MNQNLRDIISSGIYDMCVQLVEVQEPFSLLISNGNDWDKPLPDRLASQELFILKMEGDTLEDAYITDDGLIFVSTDFDGDIFEKNLHWADVQGLVHSDGKPILVKPFKEDHPKTEDRLLPMGQNIPNEEALEHSMKMFKIHNPELFSL